MSPVGGSAAPRGARSLSRSKALLFRAVVVVVTLLVLEAASLLAIEFLYGSPSILAERRVDLAQRDAIHMSDDLRRPLIVHPYLGMVFQPDPESAKEPEGTYRVTEYGFRDTNAPMRKRSPDRLIVVILGGSLARQFAWNGSETLARRLASIPEFSGRTIDFVRLATDGHKQPQQLMALNWLTTLGGEFDVVINLDGLNEAALPKIDNQPHNVRADYPRQWGSWVAQARSVEFVRCVGYITYLRDRQRGAARAFIAGPWRNSMTGLLLWEVLADWEERSIRRQQDELARMAHADLSPGVSGAPQSFDSDEDYFRNCVEVWARCSIQLHRICVANGARYFHFLQPNQYVEPLSKPIGLREQFMVSDVPRFGIPVRFCFPLMQASAARFAREGMSFCDLTQVFAEHPEPIYTDNCCHINSSGDELLAEAIGEWIRRHPGPPPKELGASAGPETSASE